MKQDICKMNRREFLVASAALAAGASLPTILYGSPGESDKNKFNFAVVSDTHVHNGQYCHAFEYITCSAIMKNSEGAGDFIVVNGDIDPFVRAKKIIDDKLVNPLKKQNIDYGFYPVIGNHDLYNTSGVEEFRTEVPEETQTRAIINYNKNNLNNIVNWGPKFESKLIGYENSGTQYTTYSFNHKNSHFVVLDLYYSNSIPGRGDGRFRKNLEEWMIKDLEQNQKKNIFVFGHEPTCYYEPEKGGAVSDPDYIYHNKERLQRILEKYKVKIYFSGHTHLFGRVKTNGVTYINTGLSMTPDSNTYAMVFVDDNKISYTLYNYNNKKWEEYSHTI